MVTADGLQRFFQKRGFEVGEVVEVGGRFIVHIDHPSKAKEVFDSVADTTDLMFVGLRKRWWQKLMFWRK